MNLHLCPQQAARSLPSQAVGAPRAACGVSRAPARQPEQRCHTSGQVLASDRRGASVSTASFSGRVSGFRLPHEEDEQPVSAATQAALDTVSADYGLSLGQLSALGVLRASGSGPVQPEMLRATNYYAGDAVTASRRMTSMMAGGGGGGGQGPGSAPPDLPSLLLDSRICYIGMPLVPSVTELVLSELLWLNYNSPDKPVYVYLHSAGSQMPNGQAVAFDSEAFAIVDTLNYIRPEVQTLALGQAHGNAAMILASGKKGKRASLPHASIMTVPPRINRSFGSTSNIMIKANELENTTEMYVDLLAKYTGREKESVRQDVGRNRYFTPEQAVEYGLIDRIVQPQDEVAMVNKDYEQELRQQAARQAGQRGRPSGGGREPEAGV